MTPRESKLWYFNQFNMINSLKPEQRERMSDVSNMLVRPAGETIYFEHDISDKIFFLKKGKIKLSRYAEDGRELILSILGKGEIFGELGLVEEGNRDETAVVLEDAVICSVSLDEFKQLMQENPAFNLSVTKLIGLRFKKIKSRMENLVFKDTRGRICTFIKDLVDEFGKEIGLYEKEVKLHLTHEDIAKLTATTRQTVTSILNKLEKEGLISYDRKRILVHEYDKLV